MTQAQQPESLQCASRLEHSIGHYGREDSFTLHAYEAMKTIRAQHARIEELEAQLEAIGAGGVEPLRSRCLHQIAEPPADGWLQDGGMLYRLTDERRPQNRDEINVTMADGSRSKEACARRAGELLDRIRAPKAAQPPTGWVMVPVEPTDAMIVHAHQVCDGTHAGDVYRAMIAAAPKAEPADPLQQLTELSEQAGLYDADFGKPAVAPEAPVAVAGTCDLRTRCNEILAWRKTGVLSGEALRTLAREKYGDEHDAIQRVERDTETEAMKFVIAAPTTQAAPQQEAQEPYAYAVYFPDQPTVELVHDLDDLTDDLTNRDHQITKLYTHPAPADAEAAPAAAAEPSEAETIIRALLDHIERNTCEHHETYRGGVIWEICSDCGAKWADDEGGKPTFEWPAPVERAREFLLAAPTTQAAPQPAAQQSGYQTALDIRAVQGWKLTGKAIPVLYTDTINGKQVMRDDVWLCTSAALAKPQEAAPVAQGDALTPAEADQLEKAITDFEECGETDVPDAALQRFAAMGYLECVHYNVLPAAHKAIDAARSQAKEGGA